MTVFLAICALLIRTLVLRMIRFTRIAESALACRMSDCLAFGTDAIRTRVRVSALSCRDAYRAACVLVVIRFARIAENALARHMSWHLEQMRFGHAFVLRECPDATHTVQYFGQPSYPVTCASEPQ